MNSLKRMFEENNALNQYNQILFKYKLNRLIIALIIPFFIILTFIDECYSSLYFYIIFIFLAFYIIYNEIQRYHLIIIAIFKKFKTNLPEPNKFQQKIINLKMYIYTFIVIPICVFLVSVFNYSSWPYTTERPEPVLFGFFIENKILVSILITIVLILNVIKFKTSKKPNILRINIITFSFIYLALISKYILFTLAFPVISLGILFWYKKIANKKEETV